MAVIRWNARDACPSGRSQPARFAVSSGVCQSSTRADASALTRLSSNAPGSATITALRTAARNHSVVRVGASGRTAFSTNSGTPGEVMWVPSQITRALATSIRPSVRAARVPGRRSTNDRARCIRFPAAIAVNARAASTSQVTNSTASTPHGCSSEATARRSSSAAARTSRDAAQDANRRPAFNISTTSYPSTADRSTSARAEASSGPGRIPSTERVAVVTVVITHLPFRRSAPLTSSNILSNTRLGWKRKPALNWAYFHADVTRTPAAGLGSAGRPGVVHSANMLSGGRAVEFVEADEVDFAARGALLEFVGESGAGEADQAGVRGVELGVLLDLRADVT
jgi:hypothetical protein